MHEENGVRVGHVNLLQGESGVPYGTRRSISKSDPGAEAPGYSQQPKTVISCQFREYLFQN
jgi:hypothetical protein